MFSESPSCRHGPIRIPHTVGKKDNEKPVAHQLMHVRFVLAKAVGNLAGVLWVPNTKRKTYSWIFNLTVRFFSLFVYISAALCVCAVIWSTHQSILCREGKKATMLIRSISFPVKRTILCPLSPKLIHRHRHAHAHTQTPLCGQQRKSIKNCRMWKSHRRENAHTTEAKRNRTENKYLYWIFE